MIIEKVKETVDRYSMLKKGERALVACSGGPDSIALLYTLSELVSEYKISLVGFHLNHNLRGEESNRDQNFVKGVFERFKIPLIIKSYNVSEYAKEKKLSLEEAAREVRYNLLKEAREEIGADRIALGHNANDNLETVIINLARGTGLSGLSGIPPTRDNIIRPLIELKREEILRFLKSKAIKYRIDRTNRDTKIPRNFIRLKVISLLLKLNPKLIETVGRTTNILREEDQFIKRITDKALKEVVIKRDKNGVWVDIELFSDYTLTVKRRVVKSLLPELDSGLTDRILKLSDGESGKRLELPKGLVAIKEYKRLYLGRLERFPTEPKEVKIGGVTHIKGWGKIRIRVREELEENREGMEIFDFDRLNPPLYLRVRKPGDRFQPFGLSSSKKLKEVMIDDKIPKRLRDYPILLCDGEGILLILGGRRSHLAKVSPETNRFLIVETKNE